MTTPRLTIETRPPNARTTQRRHALRSNGPLRAWRVVALATLLVGTLSGAAIAAPVAMSSDDDAAAQAQGLPGKDGRGGLTAQPQGVLTGKALGGSAMPEATTGNKNLDLLLDLRMADGVDEQTATAKSAARAASAGAATRTTRQAGAAVPRTGLLDEADASLQEKSAPRPKVARDWSGGSGAAAQSGGGSVGYGVGDEPAARRGGGEGGDNLFKLLPREIIDFLREYRYWILGTGAAIMLMVWAASVYARRPT